MIYLQIFETFGPVARPLYSVRFNDASEIDTERTKQGSKVYNVPELSTFLLTRVLKMQKGSDASNLYDEEVDEKVSTSMEIGTVFVQQLANLFFTH